MREAGGVTAPEADEAERAWQRAHAEDGATARAQAPRTTPRQRQPADADQAEAWTSLANPRRLRLR